MQLTRLKKNSDLFTEWQNFINSGKEPENVRPAIAASWQRCRSWGVNPLGGKSSLALHSEEFFARLEEKKPLINIVKPYLENIYLAAAEFNFVTFLADGEGTILLTLGDKETLNRFRQALNLRAGASWSEKVVGTTAIGLVLREEAPCLVSADEHYCLELKRCCSLAVPLADPLGKTTAVLGALGSCEEVPNHILGMLAVVGYSVENQFRLAEKEDGHDLTARYYRTAIDAVSEGILAVNAEGYITYLNKSAAKILLVDSEKVLGKHITKIVDFHPPVLDVLKSGEGYTDREFIINSKRGRLHFIKSAFPIKGENGRIEGVVDVFREIKQVKQLVNRMVGAQARYTFDDIIGNSREILEAKRIAAIAASSSSTVIITGESGTGKELFAQAIHNASSRARGPFIAVNCGAIPRDLIESELFGYDEGAFTGARQGGRPGKFELASGGTIFLDEIGEMPLEMQVRFLRVLQDKEITRVGGSKTLAVDVRVIAATNKDLYKEIEEGTFRRDLFWRLYVLNIHLPALVQRSGDIPLLVRFFLQKLSEERGMDYVLDDKAMKILMEYSWPGNIRELQNALERAVNFAETNRIMPHHLPKILSGSGAHLQQSRKFCSLEEAERQTIIEVLKHCQGNITKSAKILGIARNTLYFKIDKYKIEC
ncbi:MAG: sigma 54-interacting transcriptional regulator [Peptococcaceae bacterium]|jgi:PAS domain S-box-containing protein|nr:sigma 54-interacting transcriptional regulator [Peptococcaceae bacterium]MDH7524998.1 sigma 54-interacting transcriptional regulator [Peptococcaceae bacterium]